MSKDKDKKKNKAVKKTAKKRVKRVRKSKSGGEAEVSLEDVFIVLVTDEKATRDSTYIKLLEEYFDKEKPFTLPFSQFLAKLQHLDCKLRAVKKVETLSEIAGGLMIYVFPKKDLFKTEDEK